jgi:hypothetical protein
MAFDPAFEHLAVVGSQDDPGIFQQAVLLQVIVEPAKLPVYIEDIFIIFRAILCLGLLSPKRSSDFTGGP